MCQMRTDLDAVAEKKCLKKHGLWRKVPFSAEIFDDKKEMVMNNDNGELTAVESNKINRTWKFLSYWSDAFLPSSAAKQHLFGN